MAVRKKFIEQMALNLLRKADLRDPPVDLGSSPRGWVSRLSGLTIWPVDPARPSIRSVP